MLIKGSKYTIFDTHQLLNFSMSDQSRIQAQVYEQFLFIY